MISVYFDVSCLNRPFDDQVQARIRLETEAIFKVFEQIDAGTWQQYSSRMAIIEIEETKDVDKRNQMKLLLPESACIIQLEKEVMQRANFLAGFGFREADATHVACSEEAGVEVLLTCDDRMCRVANRHAADLHVKVSNPVDWLREIDDANA